MIDTDLLRRRIAFVRRGADTRRFHTKITVETNTVGYHSFGVLWFCCFLTPGLPNTQRGMLYQAAMEHDLFEHISGDMPGDAKREMGVRDIVNAFEAKGMAELGFRSEELLTPALLRVLKLADMLDGAFFCVSERSLGNQQIAEAYDNFRHYIGLLEPTSGVEIEIVQYLDDLWRKVNHG